MESFWNHYVISHTNEFLCSITEDFKKFFIKSKRPDSTRLFPVYCVLSNMLKIDTIQQEILASPDPPVQECCSFISIKSKLISTVIDGFRKDFISFNSEKLRSATGATQQL